MKSKTNLPTEKKWMSQCTEAQAFERADSLLDIFNTQFPIIFSALARHYPECITLKGPSKQLKMFPKKKKKKTIKVLQI